MADKTINRNEEIDRLREENEKLLVKLGESETKRTAAEMLNESVNFAKASHLSGNLDAVLSGKKNGDGKETYFFRVSLPPYAGHAITINGFPYNNGQTYELDVDHLRDLQSRVFNCWKHENSVRGSDENSWRRGGVTNTSAMHRM